METGNDHGTGCSLSAAIAARLAQGDEMLDAITAAKAFVHRALAGGADWHLGAGHGPVDHFGWSAQPSAGWAMTLHDADTRFAEPAEAEPLRPPTPGGFSIRPAMIVLGLAVLILAAFVTLGIVSSHSPAPVKTSGPPSAVAGSPLPVPSRPPTR